MSVLVVGISHRSAPVALLEEVTLGLGDTTGVLDELKAGAVTEAVVVSTCNRVEVYADTEGFHSGVDAITDLLARRSGVPLEELSKHLYVHWEGQAVLHLFQVACGLDSMVIGESQILGQLRRAYAASGETVGRVLHELFQTALRVGKRAHSETGIDEAGQSLVSVGLQHAVDAVGGLDGRSVLVIVALLAALVRTLPGVSLVDLERLQTALVGTDAAAGVEAAREIVTEEVGAFLTWQKASRVAPTVVALRSRAEEVVGAELARLTNRLPELGDKERSEVEQTVRRVVQTLLHTPTVRVKELTEAPAGLSYADALRELFGLDPSAPAAVTVTPLEIEEDS